MPTSRYWFPAKRYGWGWGLPSAWQGWLVLGMFFALIATAGVFIPAREHSFVFIATALLLSGVLVAICAVKGEPPRWRWGKE